MDGLRGYACWLGLACMGCGCGSPRAPEVAGAPTVEIAREAEPAPSTPAPVDAVPASEGDATDGDFLGVLASDPSDGGLGIVAAEPYLEALAPYRGALLACVRQSMKEEIAVTGWIEPTGEASFEDLRGGSECLLEIVGRAKYPGLVNRIGLLIVVTNPEVEKTTPP